MKKSGVIPLRMLAHGRVGDKNAAINISVIAFDKALFGHLSCEVTPERVRARFAPHGVREVRRYDLPRLGAMNFVITGVLDSGINGSLLLDKHGKSLLYVLLDMPVQAPKEFNKSAAKNRRITKQEKKKK